METKTHYQVEYMKKSVMPVTVHAVKDSQYGSASLLFSSLLPMPVLISVE